MGGGGTFAHERTHEAEGTLPPSQACGRARRTSIHANTRRHEGVLATTKEPSIAVMNRINIGVRCYGLICTAWP